MKTVDGECHLFVSDVNDTTLPIIVQRVLRLDKMFCMRRFVPVEKLTAGKRKQQEDSKTANNYPDTGA
jgi:hypothetical protein